MKRSAIGVLLVGVVGLGVWLAVGRAPSPVGRVRLELVEPYAAALRAVDVEDAWQRFTTEGYRAHVPEAVFLAGQARNRDELGELVRLVVLPDEPVPVTNEPGRPPMLRVTLRWEGTEGDAVVVFDVVDGPPWRIERTWAWPPDGLAVERVY